jgi:hypothetical protein
MFLMIKFIFYKILGGKINLSFYILKIFIIFLPFLSIKNLVKYSDIDWISLAIIIGYTILISLIVRQKIMKNT